MPNGSMSKRASRLKKRQYRFCERGGGSAPTNKPQRHDLLPID